VSRPRSIALLALVAGLAGCGLVDHAGNRGASEEGRDIFGLWRPSMIAALAVGALVWGLIVFAVVRYRRRGDAIPDQTQYVVRVEVLYTIVPVLIVAVLFAFSYRTQRDVDDLVDDPDVVIDVQGFQWQWQFRYVGEGITVSGLPDQLPVMVLPVDSTVRLNLISRDVIHSFYVPEFLYKRDVIPGVRNRIDVEVDELGRYRGRCAEFCGLDHARMTFEVEAVTKGDFRDWVAAEQAKGGGGGA
jgi:cytochrome c oxidase subunit II